jgi:hypothetical protein
LCRQWQTPVFNACSTASIALRDAAVTGAKID